MKNKVRKIIALSSIALSLMLSIQLFADTGTVCEESELECSRVIIGNHVYVHEGTKVVQTQE